MKPIVFIDSKNSMSKEKIALCYDDEEEILEIIIDMKSYNFDIKKISDKDIKKGVEDFLNFSNRYFPEQRDENLSNILEQKPLIIKDYIMKAEEYWFGDNFAEINAFFSQNKDFWDKKIIFNIEADLDMNLYNTLQRKFGFIKDLKITVKGNSEPVSLAEYKETIRIIEQKVQEIKNYDLSPFEQIMYAYDIARDRLYALEDDDQKFKSRDLTAVLLGDKITCGGFVEIFNAILTKLGIKCACFSLKSVNSKRHARSIVYIDDDKYDIKGLYFFDPTFDCKKNDNNDMEYLNKYLYFAKTYQQMQRMDKGCFKTNDFVYFDENKIEELENNLKNKNHDLAMISDFENVHLSLINSLTDLNINVLDFVLEPMKFIAVLKDAATLANQKISLETFLRVLYEVRKRQYYANPTKYAFDMETIINIMHNSIFDKQTRKLLALFGEEDKVVTRVKKYMKDNNLDSGIERVKVTRLLKTIANNKES